MKVFELNEKKCMLCGRVYPHRKIFYKLENDLKEVEFLLNCATCRNILKRKKEIDILMEERKMLARERVNIQWETFMKK